MSPSLFFYLLLVPRSLFSNSRSTNTTEESRGKEINREPHSTHTNDRTHIHKHTGTQTTQDAMAQHD
uniref:Putative secreted protein n=1 Tax=Anopheles triannulatus TaxID=58253 RepID=A0A2M4B109_9DIPT